MTTKTIVQTLNKLEKRIRDLEKKWNKPNTSLNSMERLLRKQKNYRNKVLMKTASILGKELPKDTVKLQEKMRDEWVAREKTQT